MRRITLILLIVLLVGAFAWMVYALDPPHNFTNTIDCSSCHTAHKAAGGAITITAGNANLCQSCHTDGGLATGKPFAEADQALPGPGLPSGTNPTGTSHRWDSGASGHEMASGTNTSTGEVQSGGTFTGRYAKTYTISITTQGDTGTARFNWSAVRWPGDTGGGSGTNVLTAAIVALNEGITVAFTNGTSSPSFKLNDSWKVYVRTDINQPTNAALAARISDGKIMCSTCHNQHSQAAIPFDPSAPAYGGSGTGEGRHYQRVNNDTTQTGALGSMCLDCHSARDKGSLSGQTGNLTHPIGLARSIWNGLFKARASITLPLDKGADGVAGNTDDRIQCLSCHKPHFTPTNDGSLTRLTDITSLCADCHTLADTASGSHFNTTTGVLWPGGQYGSTFPAITDAGKRGACINCHQPHGWPDAAAPTQDYAKLLVDKQENLCYTCHDGTVTTTANVYAQFNGSTNFQISGGINQRHDVSDADQLFSGAVVECTNCHNPHLANGTNKLINPKGWSDGTTTFVAGQPFTKTYSPSNQYGTNSYRSATTDQDPLNPEGAGQSSVGSAVANPANTGDNTATSGGNYTGSQDQTYTVTVSTGGAPGTARITVTSTGSDSSGPTTVTAFGTAVAVGNFGVTINFTEPYWPSRVGPATCTSSCVDDTATSSNSYTGPSKGTYTLNVTTAGAPGTARITCTSNITGDACNPSTIYTWPGNGTIFNIGSYGARVAITDSSAKAWELAVGETWQIPVSDGVLTLNDRWTIAVTAAGAAFSEPDYVAFCLTCHDGTPPAGVTMTAGLTNIASAYLASNGNKMGAAPGRTGTTIGNGYLKFPWHVQPASCSSPTWTGCQDPNLPYAALQCTTCHDGHGSDSIYHLRTQITVGGVQMKVGGDNPNSQFGPGTFARWGTTTYSLPCQGGNGNTNCANNPTGAQGDFYYGAWCSFCHEMSSHPSKSETTVCSSTHAHSSGNF
ncbi:MAG: hypothetical protein HYY46_16950 [Deltaproteobacteria bacterium]|nr:hypothetical protein [Deltaproteobacteria bacterium]